MYDYRYRFVLGRRNRHTREDLVFDQATSNPTITIHHTTKRHDTTRPNTTHHVTSHHITLRHSLTRVKHIIPSSADTGPLHSKLHEACTGKSRQFIVSCLLRTCFAPQGMSQGTCTVALKACQSSVYRKSQPTGRVLIVFVIETASCSCVVNVTEVHEVSDSKSSVHGSCGCRCGSCD